MPVIPYSKNIVIDPSDIQPILEAMDRGIHAIIVEAPPGAGKTFLTAFCIAHGIDRLESMLYVASSYEQAYGMCLKTLAIFPNMRKKPVIYGSKSSKIKYGERFLREGITFITDYKDLAKCIRDGTPVATVLRKIAASLMMVRGAEKESTFRWIIIDEAWQITDADFALVSPLGEGFVMVGDRGQIPPIVKSDIARWRDDPSGPHRPAPEALLAREHVRPYILERPMTRSRRLPQRTAEVVQSIFYPRLQFRGSDEPRTLIPSETKSENNDVNRAIDLALKPNPPGFIAVEVTGNQRKNATDVGALNAMASIAIALLENPPQIDDKRGDKHVTDDDIVLLVSRNQERRYLGSLLREAYPNLTIATANKFQGSEKAISIALHPLSGKTEITAFDSDSGRLCVMLSRHTHACFVIHRPGILEMLQANVPNTPRAIGDSIDWSHAGWKSNSDYAAWMKNSGALVNFDCTKPMLLAEKTKVPEEVLA